MKRENFFVIDIIFLVVALAVTVYFLLNLNGVFEPSKISGEKQISEFKQAGCLNGNKIASYEIVKEIKGEAANIITTNKNSNQEITRFQTSGIILNHYHAYELHKCNAYVIRQFNYIPETRRKTPGYRIELWSYDYTGRGNSIITFSKTDERGVYMSSFNDDFRIDPNEKYLVLEKSYLGQDDYALVIKDLNTKEDLIVLKLKDILAKYPDVIPGSFGLGSWTKDGKYLYGDLFQGALSTAYYRIEAGNWKTDIFPAPPDILAGVERAINYDKMYLAYVDIPTFTGVQEVYEQIIEQAKKEGKQKNFYLYNLATKEKVKIASAEPEWRFNIEWISNSELQYELPSGEKKVYKINEN